LVNWKVKDADELLSAALKTPIGKHRLAAEALGLQLGQPSPSAKARELTALYAAYGQPRALRLTAIDALQLLGKDDPALQDLLIPMIEDPDRSMRMRAWRLAGALKVKKALPALEARLSKEGGGSTGFTGFGAPATRQILENAIKELKGTGDKPSASPAASSASTSKSLADLEQQAEKLESTAKELRKQIEALKPAAK
jgi:hypothetical protein